MAGKPVGTIFVELDLDASRYTKGQQKLLKDAQSTSLNIEQNFKNLGIKSSAEMDLMRAKIKNSFDMIANSSKATANDIIRAEEAKNAKLKALNDKQFGEQKSFLDSLKSNWIAYAASVYAVTRAIGQAVEMAKTGSMLEKQATAFGNLASAAGTNARRILDSLKAISGGMVAETDLMAAAGKAMLMSIPADKITELMKIAAATSRATGQTITDAFNDITMGVARQSRMILDNLGIIVNVDKANQDYAKALGMTSDSLSDTQKRQAFMNATLAAGNEMITRLGQQQGELTGVNKLVAAQSDLWAEVNKTVAVFLDEELAGYAKMLNWFDAKLKGMRQAQGEATRTELWKEIEMLRSLEAKGMAFPGGAAAKEAEFNRRYLAPQFGLKPSEELKRTGSFSTPAWDSSSWRQQEGTWAANTAEENKKILEAFAEGAKKAEEAAKKSLEVNKIFWGEYKKEVAGAAEFEKYKLDEQYREFDKYVHDKVALAGWYEAELKKIQLKERERIEKSSADAAYRVSGRSYANVDTGAAGRAIEAERAAVAKADEAANAARWWKTYVDGTEDATRANEIFTDSMDIMAQSAADAFAEFVMGTKSASDAFASMTQSMIAALVRLSTQKFAEQIFGAIGSALPSLFSGGSTPTGMGTNTSFAGGGTMGGYMALVKHGGGMVHEPAPVRMLPAALFASAPRLHDGIGPGEYPAVLRRDEAVLTPGQLAAVGKTQVIVNNNTPAQANVTEQADPGGMRKIFVTIGSDIQAGGPIAKSFESAYGLRRRGRLG